MYIQTNNSLIHLDLPAQHWLAPDKFVNLTADNAELFGYVPVQKHYTRVTQNHLDDTAQTKGYDDVLSACSYAAVPNLFQAESIQFIAWRSAVWAYLYQEFGKVMGGLRELPVPNDMIAELPKLEDFASE